MDKIEMSITALSALIGKSAEASKKMLQKEDGTALEPSEIETRVLNAVNEKIKTATKNATDTATKNASEKRERKIAEKFGIDTYNDFEDLIEQASKKGAGTDPAKESEQVKQLTEKINLLNSENKNLKKTVESGTAELAKTKSTFKLQRMVESKAQKFNLDNLPEEVRAAYMDTIVASINGTKEDNGALYLLNQDGSVMVDENSNSVTLDSWMDKKFSHFGVRNPNGGGNGTPNPNGGGGGGSNVTKYGKEFLSNHSEVMTKNRQLIAEGNRAEAQNLLNQYNEHVGSGKK